MKKILTIGDKSYKLIYEDFEDEDVDVDKLLKIDYSNLIGEMITIPIWICRFGNLLADAESQVAERKINVEVMEAKLKEKYRIELMEANGGKNPTVDQLNTAISLDKSYQTIKKSYISAQKTRDYINSIFWSLKEKSNKIEKLSLTIQNTDIPEEVIEGRVNGIMVKKNNRPMLIK